MKIDSSVLANVYGRVRKHVNILDKKMNTAKEGS